MSKHAAPEPPYKRLLVELTEKTDDALDGLSAELGLNKTTVVNRAVQIYQALMEHRSDDDSITILGTRDQGHGTSGNMFKLWLKR